MDERRASRLMALLLLVAVGLVLWLMRAEPGTDFGSRVLGVGTAGGEGAAPNESGVERSEVRATEHLRNVEDRSAESRDGEAASAPESNDSPI